MKKSYKSQQLKLPLIEQFNAPYFSRLSKDSTQRSHRTSRNSYEIAAPSRKQKKLSKPSNFNPFIQNQPILQHRTLQQKELSKSFGNTFSQTLTDFEEKIKQNKILLKKYQLQRQTDNQKIEVIERDNNKKRSIVKKPFSVGKQNNKNQPITSKNNNNNKILLSAVNSRKFTKRESPKINQFQSVKENKRYFSNVMDQGESKSNDAKAVTDTNEVLSDEISRKSNPLNRLNSKLKPNDIFQNIHILLKGLQSEGSLPEKQIKTEKVNRKLLKFKKKLQKLEPESQFLSSINKKIKNNQSLPSIPKLDQNNSGEEKPFKRQTMYHWERFVINSKKEIKEFSSSFNEEIEKVDLYLNKSSTYLEQLLKNKIRMLDLALLKKINSKKPQNKSKLFRKG